MGSWSTDNLSNDTALDWIGSFLQKPALKKLETKLSREAKDASQAEEFLAAAEVLALLRGHPAVDAQDDLRLWAQRCKWEVPNSCVKAVLHQIIQIGKRSELLELYQEAENEKEWQQTLLDLQKRLKSKPVPLIRLPKPAKSIQINGAKIDLDGNHALIAQEIPKFDLHVEVAIDKSWTEKHIEEALEILLQARSLMLDLNVYELGKKLSNANLMKSLNKLAQSLKGIDISVCAKDALDLSFLSNAADLEHVAIHDAFRYNFNFVATSKRLQTLVLRDLESLKTLPNSDFLEHLSHLKRVRLEYSYDPSGKQIKVPNLPDCVEEVYFSSGSLAGPTDYASWKKAPNLRQLSLSDAGLKELPELPLEGLESLVLIYTPELVQLNVLRGLNRLVDLGLYSLESLTDFSFLRTLPQLQELYLSSAPLASPWDDLKTLKHMETCSLKSLMQTTELPPFPSMRRLFLDNIRIQNLNSIAGCPFLEELELFRIETETFDNNIVKLLPNLKRLSYREISVKGSTWEATQEFQPCRRDLWPSVCPPKFNPWKSDFR
jgi:hypothetical protein